MMIALRNRHHQARHYRLWDVVATLAAVLVGHAAAGATGAGAEDPAAAVLVHHGAAATVGRAGAGVAEDTQAQASQYSPQFLTYVDQVIDDLVRVHNAFWTEGQWYNMTLKSENPIFGLFYDRPGAVQVITDPTDPTGIYDNKKKKKRSTQDLPFIYQSAPPAVSCTNAASTSIISGSKAVDFASFAIGIMTLVININNNINNNNNNNNNLNLNAVDSSNIVANFNTNNANQVNIMPPGGRRRKRSVTGSAAIMIIAAIKAALMNSQENMSKNEVPDTKIDLRKDSIVSKIQQIVVDKMIKDPNSRVMAGCSDMKNCQRRLSLFI